MKVRSLNSTFRKVIFVLTTSLLLLCGSKLVAQQQIYSYAQYADNLTPVNAAYSMLDKAGSISVMGRRQFIGIDGAPTSLLLSGTIPIESITGAAGVYVLNDQVAVEKQLEINAFFAKSVQLSGNDFLAVSINAGIRNYVANYSTLDSFDPQFKDDVRETSPNLGFGVMFYSERYYLGLSLPELTIRSLGTASVQQANYLKNHFYFSGGYLVDMGEDIKFKPSALVAYVKNAALLTDVTGTIYLKEQLGIGAGYRSNKRAAGILSVIGDTYKVGYSYQFGTSSNTLGGFNTAIHEVSLSYRFGKTGVKKLL